LAARSLARVGIRFIAAAGVADRYPGAHLGQELVIAVLVHGDAGKKRFQGGTAPFAPVPKPTIETGVEAMTLAVLSVFDQHAREK
jgi:hypothetical protein